MSARLFYDRDCSLAPLSEKTVVFLGYGNQGRAQALNLRETFKAEGSVKAPKIVIANQEDSYAETAKKDGFNPTSNWGEAAAEADVVFLLVPDEVQPQLFNEQVAPKLKKTACVVVASGYNVFYKYLNIGSTNDVIMAAPRMVGASVRSLYEARKGFPCFVSVEQDGTGNAWPIALSICRGIGATKGGAIESSCREEALTDLFAEQAIFPMIISVFQEGYKMLKSLGCSDEALCHEMFLSKEPAEIFEMMADKGFIKQLVDHSTVSQYGQLKGSLEMDTSWMQKVMKHVAEERILGGSFTKEFTDLEKGPGGVDGALKKLYKEAEKSELAVGEKRVRERLGLVSRVEIA